MKVSETILWAQPPHAWRKSTACLCNYLGVIGGWGNEISGVRSLCSFFFSGNPAWARTRLRTAV